MARQKKQPKQTKVVESYVDLAAPLPWFPTGTYSTQGIAQSWLQGGPYGGVPPWALSYRYDDGSGMLRPVYITNYQAKIIRDRARELAFFNPFASACTKIYQDYVVGTGINYDVIGVRDGVPEKLIKQAQEVVDLYCEFNDISNKFENELVWRLLNEGECIVRSFPQDNGLLAIRVVEPELLYGVDTNDPDISYGIICKNKDIHNVIGYSIVEEPEKGLHGVFVPMEEVNYLKINTPSNAKRGLPQSFACDQQLRSASSVLQSMISLANARSKIAMIRTIEDSSPDAVESLRERTTDLKISDPITQQSFDIEHLGYGSILTSSGNIKYEFPSLSMASDDMISTLQQTLRTICSHYGISEVQLSSNPGNANYASSIVAESPSYKNFLRWQKMVGDFIGAKRTKPQQSLIWKQLIYSVSKGMLPSNALTDLKIVYRGPTLEARNKLEEAQTNKIYADMGIMSNKDIARQQNINLEDQKKHMDLDDNIDQLLQTVTKLKAAGLDADASKAIMKKYHPHMEPEFIEQIFKNTQETNVKPEEPKKKAGTKIPRKQTPQEPEPPRPRETQQ